eukprot:CAMPEP_0173393138 /NCGR_PEP_ID=MMETSP1356-20130122/21936_1 /TAXON_ID=77927 ORGANISM="Hemiselmis virescens, Strain PCC157" /NCGR_SAMPLE_ID=MMETSP1356 /ASSEMBLY_ACC=CAM_ASM_000847 /LENGTH=267 /DNA_ID=CAMNT_0014351115 /DNA_START=13 /DNA_END=816 /DNA_ORIENTATION=+
MAAVCTSRAASRSAYSALVRTASAAASSSSRPAANAGSSWGFATRSFATQAPPSASLRGVVAGAYGKGGLTGLSGGRWGVRWQTDGAKPAAEEKKEAEGGEAAGVSEADKLKDEQIAKLTAECKDMKHKMLTAYADVENMRVRMANKAEEDRKFAVRSFAKNMLEVADVLDKALESCPEDKRKTNADLQLFYEGVQMTNKMFLKGLEEQKVRRFDPVGEKFNPEMHDAKFEMPVPEGGEAGMVAACIKVGYTIHDRCLRPAEVGVTK